MASEPNSGSQSPSTENLHSSVNPPNSGLRTDFIGNSAIFPQCLENVPVHRVILPSSSDVITSDATVQNIDSRHASTGLPACSPSVQTAQTQQVPTQQPISTGFPFSAGPFFAAGSPHNNTGDFQFMFQQFAQAMAQGFQAAVNNNATDTAPKLIVQDNVPSSGTEDESSFGTSLDDILQDSGPAVDAEVIHLKESDEDSDLLAQLSDHFAQEEQVGEKISDVLAKAIVPVFRSQISKDKKKALLALHNRPENCDTVKTPKINKSVWNHMSRSARDADVSSQIIQSGVCSVAYPLLHLTDKLYTAKANQRPIYGSDLQECLKLATDTFKLVQMVHSDLSSRRRAAIQPHLNPTYRDLCSPDTPVTDMLFGDDLDKRIKDLTDARNVTKKLTKHGSGLSGYRGNRQHGHSSRSSNFGHNSRTHHSSGQFSGSRNATGNSYHNPHRHHPYGAQHSRGASHQHHNRRPQGAYPAHKTAAAPFLEKHQKIKQKP